MSHAILCGCIGGLLPDILRIIKTRYKKRLPSYLSTLNFWLGILFLVAIGGLTAWLLEAEKPKEALAYGFAAPELLSRFLAKSIEEIDRGGPFRLREWWGM